MAEHIINQRITNLRRLLRKLNLAACIIPSTDPHLSEYVSPYWEARKWISGFTGSAGTIVVTLNEAGLWTDSRYFLQASEQLSGSEIKLYKEMLPETPSITDFLCSVLKASDMVGINGEVFSTNQVLEMQKTLIEKKGIKLNSDFDAMKELWKDRPLFPKSKAYIYNEKYAGINIKAKIEVIRKEMQEQKIEALFLSSLDEIAWVLNLRGNDVKCNPVVISYLLITQDKSVYFIYEDKVSKEVRSYLEKSAVCIEDYNSVAVHLMQLETANILFDPNKTNYHIFSAINPKCQIKLGNSPVNLLKAVRNETEINGIRNAMTRDGIALTKFLIWLEANVPLKSETEISIDKKLHEFRAQQVLYMGESFDTIAGYKEHAAIVHYSATTESDVTLHPEGFLLLDSGAQYLDGTTDITRTIALGKLTQEEKIDYTLVLKGHINLAMAKFPAGTRGVQLDVLARMPLWQRGMNYLHGTGHGVGHFLNVHEGPQSIRMNENPIVLQPGMLTSNEPGIYKSGSHGIRIENLLLVCKDQIGMFGEYLKFETVTLCPICKEGIIKELLSNEEITWLNEYHQTVYQKLSPHLSDEEKKWLKDKTEKLA
ncbi:aminopeptidase P family protein [uncultured Bacteroides sp.]|uniref:aminopeptidase P family protein n=1 Tax=uncultured Bacteroides sp. TaxID=162156 RepID=UPI002AAAB20E|nr:aminopeptidase P family protein [uncultured Bacteroides sp.]